jgi:hypothetical protein
MNWKKNHPLNLKQAAAWEAAHKNQAKGGIG